MGGDRWAVGEPRRKVFRAGPVVGHLGEVAIDGSQVGDLAYRGTAAGIAGGRDAATLILTMHWLRCAGGDGVRG